MRYLHCVVAFAILLSFANGAPTKQMRRSRRHDMRDVPISISTTPWINPCDIKNDTTAQFIVHPRTQRPWKGLREQMQNYIIQLGHYNDAIRTDDISQWFWQFNSTFRFMARLNGSSYKIQLRKRHTETQVYVGAFQYLTWKQFHHPKKGADRTNKLNALKNLSWLSKNLLCEIETAINNTRMRMPKILSREEMNERLTFHNNGNKISFDTTKVDEVDEIDYKYAKVRFSEYLHALQQMLQNRRGKQHHANKNTAAKELSTSVNKAVHATDMTTLKRSRENHSRKNLRKSLRPNSNTNAQHNLHHNQFDSNISATKHSEHHRPLHRKRVGQGKKRRMQKQSRNGVAGVGNNAMQIFRRNQRKSTVSPNRVPRVSTSTTTTTTTTTTTVAPQT